MAIVPRIARCARLVFLADILSPRSWSLRRKKWEQKNNTLLIDYRSAFSSSSAPPPLRYFFLFFCFFSVSITNFQLICIWSLCLKEFCVIIGNILLRIKLHGGLRRRRCRLSSPVVIVYMLFISLWCALRLQGASHQNTAVLLLLSVSLLCAARRRGPRNTSPPASRRPAIWRFGLVSRKWFAIN